jgi:tetratricopeptide (TPR) repeat protein
VLGRALPAHVGRANIAAGAREMSRGNFFVGSGALRARRVALLVLTLCALPVARADDADDPAHRRFRQGVALFNEGDFNAALAEFEGAYRLQPLPSILYNVALSEKALFRYGDSIAHFERYLAEARNIEPERQAEVRDLLARMRALLAELRLTITPEGAAVVIDGRLVGSAPLAPVLVAAGHRVIELSAEGHHPLRREITAIAGEPLALTIALEPLPRTGRLRLQVTPPGALVWLDGRAAGSAPLELELQQGGHTLEAAAPGHHKSRRELVIVASEQREMALALERLPAPLYRRWWLWTAVGAAAAALAVGIAVPLSLERADPVPGTLGTFKAN